MKWTYQGQEISYTEARRLHDIGEAHADGTSPNVGRMIPGASDEWIAKTRPILEDFLKWAYEYGEYQMDRHHNDGSSDPADDEELIDAFMMAKAIPEEVADDVHQD